MPSLGQILNLDGLGPVNESHATSNRYILQRVILNSTAQLSTKVAN